MAQPGETLAVVRRQVLGPLDDLRGRAHRPGQRRQLGVVQVALDVGPHLLQLHLGQVDARAHVQGLDRPSHGAAGAGHADQRPGRHAQGVGVHHAVVGDHQGRRELVGRRFQHHLHGLVGRADVGQRQHQRATAPGVARGGVVARDDPGIGAVGALPHDGPVARATDHHRKAEDLVGRVEIAGLQDVDLFGRTLGDLVRDLLRPGRLGP